MPQPTETLTVQQENLLELCAVATTSERVTLAQIAERAGLIVPSEDGWRWKEEEENGGEISGSA